MIIGEHYNSYREAVKRDALEGYATAAAHLVTRDAKNYPTAMHYLKECVQNIESAVAANDSHAYQKLLRNHQKAMVMVFEKMVSDFVEALTYKTIDGFKITDAVFAKGLNWFRFSKITIGLSNGLILIPRYSNYFKTTWTYHPCIDAGELRRLDGANESQAQNVFQTKKRHTSSGREELCIYCGDTFYDSRTINSPVIRDWTLELLP